MNMYMYRMDSKKTKRYHVATEEEEGVRGGSLFFVVETELPLESHSSGFHFPLIQIPLPFHLGSTSPFIQLPHPFHPLTLSLPLNSPLLVSL